VTVAIQTDRQVAPQPRGPVVCFLEDEDLDRRIPNVWGFQLLDSVTTQPLAESNPFTPLVNFTPLSEDRGLSSYPPQRLSSPRLTVSGPSTAVTAASDPSVIYCPTPSGPSAVCRSTSGPSAAPVTISGPVPSVSPLLVTVPPVSSLPTHVSPASLDPVPASSSPL